MTPARITPARAQHFVGISPYAEAVRQAIAWLAREDCTLMICGPTGSGKKVVTRALHAASGRGPLVRLPAVQLDGELARAELAGSLKGAYTDADRDRPGLVSLADGGMLVVDDADRTAARGQLWLLEVAEHEGLLPVGGKRVCLSNVRLVVCFQAAPEWLVRKKFLRDDLFRRLDQERIVLQPLCDHMEDLPALVQDALEREAARRNAEPVLLSDEALFRLMHHSWPGNVRELETTMERACRRARRDALAGARLCIEAHHCCGITPPAGGTRGRVVRVSEDRIREVLAATGNNVRRSASALGIGERTLWRRVKEHAIELRGA